MFSRRRLSGAALLVEFFVLHRSARCGIGGMEAEKDVVGGVLEARVGFVELASRFGGELAELIAIFKVGQCPKDQVRAHAQSSSSKEISSRLREPA